MYTECAMRRILTVFFTLIFLLTSSFILISVSQVSASKENLIVSPLPNDLKINSNNYNGAKPINLRPVLKNKINILFLGLDGRRGDSHPRCDAIHLISFDFDKNLMTITSVPRGTEIQLSQNTQDIDYISNYCHYFGTDAASAQIEKITGLHPDYTVKLGFSQTLGIFRNLNIPTTPTLQFLRSRANPFGDFQRTHNQAVFIKDMFTKNFDTFENIPDLFKYLIYKMVDTNMPYDVAKELLSQIKNSQKSKNPDLIKLSLKPDLLLPLKDIHLANSDNNWINDAEFKEYQDNLNIYLKTLLDGADTFIKSGKNASAFNLIKTPFSQQIWSQLENERLRNNYHFRLLKYYLQTSPDNENLAAVISDFINEMAITHQDDFKNKGEILLNTVI
ncbi:LCP family protein [Candidatus Gottesmanbacteria bacterium]|nr:LCP family protein [Candidatus Gottesmanbacteria bacterium]